MNARDLGRDQVTSVVLAEQDLHAVGRRPVPDLFRTLPQSGNELHVVPAFGALQEFR